MKKLRNEICKFILAKVGLVPPPDFGKLGITTKDFLLKKNVSINFEDELGNVSNENFGVWCGESAYNNMKIRIIAADICDNKINYHEFISVYNVDNGSTNAIKCVYGDDENFSLFITKIYNGWKQVGTYEMFMSAAGFERMASVGVLWKPCEEYEDLYKTLIEVINM